MKSIDWKCDILSGALKPEKLSKFLVTETVQALHPHPWVFFRLLGACKFLHVVPISNLSFFVDFFYFILHFCTIAFVFMSGNSCFKFQWVFKFQNTKLITFDGHSRPSLIVPYVLLLGTRFRRPKSMICLPLSHISIHLMHFMPLGLELYACYILWE